MGWLYSMAILNKYQFGSIRLKNTYRAAASFSMGIMCVRGSGGTVRLTVCGSRGRGRVGGVSSTLLLLAGVCGREIGSGWPDEDCVMDDISC